MTDGKECSRPKWIHSAWNLPAKPADPGIEPDPWRGRAQVLSRQTIADSRFETPDPFPGIGLPPSRRDSTDAPPFSRFPPVDPGQDPERHLSVHSRVFDRVFPPGPERPRSGPARSTPGQGLAISWEPPGIDPDHPRGCPLPIRRSRSDLVPGVSGCPRGSGGPEILRRRTTRPGLDPPGPWIHPGCGLPGDPGRSDPRPPSGPAASRVSPRKPGPIPVGPDTPGPPG